MEQRLRWLVLSLALGFAGTALLAAGASPRASGPGASAPGGAGPDGLAPRLRLRALEAEVEAVLARARDGARLPGLSAAFALPDGRVGTAVAGLADVEAQAPMTPDARFMAGSVGKSLHAALALALHREGALDLDAPISRWIGDAPWFERLPNAPALTLRLLLQHRSGLADHLRTFAFLRETFWRRLVHGRDASFEAEELVAPALGRAPEFPAGRGFAYGDTNYVLAGLVIGAATGRSAFELIEERFLHPLRLDGIAVARSHEIPGLCAGYQLPFNPFLLPPKVADREALAFDPKVESTAGGFASTPRDLVRWARVLFEGRALPGPYLRDLVEHSVPTGDGRRYGLGVFVYTTPLGPAWGHGGYFPGYRSELRYFPGSRIAVAVQTNRNFLVDLESILLEVATRVVREGEVPPQGLPTRAGL